MARSLFEDRDSDWQPELELPLEAPSTRIEPRPRPKAPPTVIEIDNGTDSEQSSRVIIIDLG